MAAGESQKTGKHFGMAEIIREALTEFLEKRGLLEMPEEDIKLRMLSTRGKLDKGFEDRVKDAQKGFNEWEIKSV